MNRLYLSCTGWLFAFLLFLCPSAWATTFSLIDSGDTWKYLANGTDPGANFKNPAFDDSSWFSGNSSFGFGDTPADTTTLPYGPNASNKYKAYYFRHTFNVPSGTPVSFLTIGLRRDDGAIVYLNGTEVRRDNMPDGPVTYNVLANVGVDGANETAFTETIIPASLLVSGQNTIAVEVHQNSVGSSDLHFSLYLNASDAAPCYGEAKPGISAIFSDPLEVLSGSDGWQHAGNEREIPTDYGMAFDLAYNLVDSGQAGNLVFTTTDLLSGQPLPDNGLLIMFNTKFNMLTERIDTRNFLNIRGYADFMAEAAQSWNSGDSVKASILTSTDGVTYTEQPWFEYKGVGAASTVSETLVAETAPNKWLVPTGASVDTTWFQTGFVDTTWTGGIGGLGYENSPGDATNYSSFLAGNTPAVRDAIKTQMFTSAKPSIYIRIPFTVSSLPADYVKLELHLRWEDGYVAYLNGTKLSPTGNAPATLAYNSLATTTRADTDAVNYQIIDITANKNLLLSGGAKNILAIHGMNSPATSSDMLIQAKLIAYKTGPADPTTLAALSPSLGDPYTHFDTGTTIPDGTRSVRLKFTGQLTRIKDTDYSNGFYFDNIRFTGEPIAPDNFGTYMTTQLPSPTYTESSRAANVDADFDHIPNLLEYAMASDSGVNGQIVALPAGPTPIVPTLTFDENGYALFTYRRIGEPSSTVFNVAGYEAVRDLEYYPQLSYDGTLWLDRGFFGLSNIVDNDDGTLSITVRTLDPVLLVNPRVLFRLKSKLIRVSWLGDPCIEE